MSELVEQAPEVPPIVEDVDLTKYAETRYLSKNKTLKMIMGQIEKGQVTKDEEIFSLISTNNYQGFDAYVRAHPGAQEFFRILQQILLFEYSGIINRKQVQNSLGIQQARWACDDANCAKIFSNERFPMLSYNLVAVNFFYWQDIQADIQSIILTELYFMIGHRMYEGPMSEQIKMHLDYYVEDIDVGACGENCDEESREKLNNALNDSIWYLVTDSRKQNPGGSWQFSVPYFPIPETLRQLSLISCIHVPELIFGILSEETLTKYIMTYEKRPYICHLPESKGNLCNVHTLRESIFGIWYHDFFHSKNAVCYSFYHHLNREAKKFVEGWNDVTAENIMEQLSDPTSKLNVLFDLSKTNNKVKDIFRAINDTGWLFSNNRKVSSFGGKKRKSTKRKSKSKRKTKRKRNTKGKRNTKRKRKC